MAEFLPANSGPKKKTTHRLGVLPSGKLTVRISSLLKITIEIVDLPIKNGDFQ